MGYLKIILGCMFSGKTSKLITIYKRNLIADIPTCIINYIDDVRYDAEKLSTHDGVKVPCMRAKNLKEIINDKLIKHYDVILINEGQFFSDIYEVVKSLVNDYDKTVYVGGLDGDYKMERFGDLLNLIPLCNEVEKLNAICGICKGRASFTKRIGNMDGGQVIIGGSETYIPVCRNCHN
jgi:thymidine kinase